MADRSGPKVYSIAPHRGFADALVAGLVPRYREPGFGLARLTLLLPSTRARRTLTEAFIRHFGANEGEGGLLLPRMAVVGDLDLDEALGPLLDPLGAEDIPRAVAPMDRWLALARVLEEEMGEDAPKGATLYRLARETAATMDRLLAEEIAPEELIGERVKDLLGDLADHWQRSLVTFARVQQRWLHKLTDRNAVDTATRRNLLFRHAARAWRAAPPAMPIVAAGVTSAAPSIAALLRTISDLPQGAVVLPDLDLTMEDAVWEELGCAGAAPERGAPPFAKGDAVSHPQYHLKLLLNRMGVNRAEVQPWHRRGEAAAPPARARAISSLFMPPQASRRWAELPADKRRLAGVRIMQSRTPEEEAQATALLVREALEVPGKRVAIVTPDRPLARRIVAHLARWGIAADDTAGRPLSQTAAGRLLLLAAEVAASGPAPVALTALLTHPLAAGGIDRRVWLEHTRTLELALRGPRPRAGLATLRRIAAKAGARAPGFDEWWRTVDPLLESLAASEDEPLLGEAVARLTRASEALAGETLWAREDGRALARFVEELGLAADAAGTRVAAGQLDIVLRDAMEEIAVRPAYGADSRVAIYGLLESRMTRAELVVACGLNEGTWPARAGADALLAPPVLRALGVPGADFRSGLSAHDLAGAMGAPEVVLSRAARDESGPAIPSRFLLRVQALLGDLLPQHEEKRAVVLARALADAPRSPPYPRPEPCPAQEQRDVAISATALDRLLGDPYQFYAQAILQLRELEGIDADPGPAWQGQTVHTILERWHAAAKADPGAQIAPIMDAVMEEANANPLLRALWEPRLMAALGWATEAVRRGDREVLAVEIKGEMERQGVRIHGRADRIDRLPDGGLGIVDYKTGKPPSAKQVAQGFALQLGVLGLIAEAGGFPGVVGNPEAFEYWSLAKSDKSPTGFGFTASPVGKLIAAEDFLPLAARKLDHALATYIKGAEPFRARQKPDYPGYATYDQLMRLAEWLPHEGGGEGG
ncbi:double-strand break repair protein AddB [Qipengyuania sediminis]|uniref:double-strand break repair protein AddB n=1 Tax=Qipengyuania sediminis TaxID=1532023 RepID=UPI00105A4FD2|nr:double-strand break repair protein AddB [Qipengyuania sediminis]